MNTAETSDPLNGIAIIGMAGRFPGAKNIDAFWHNLQNGVESISFFSDEELQAVGIDRDTFQNPQYVKAGGVLEDIELFDAAFFGYSPREASIIDPQHRLFLECAWEALESAGYDAETSQGRIGVYAGVGPNGYWLSNLYSDYVSEAAGTRQAILHGNEKDHLAPRVSYKLNLKGPSITLQTACSTSLVAVCLACQSLLSGESDMMLAGGVSISAQQTTGYFYQEGGIVSPDGHCRAFDAKAQGTVFGSGLGIVVLKRLSDALADGDCIHAVIRGAAMNNDGASKVGYTAPSVDGQAEVIAEALAMAEVAAETVTYIETHGTGTALGDPIEIAALTQAFRVGTEAKGFCALGSVKTNVGHLNTAAGVTGLLKTTLALKHKTLPPSLHFDQPNPAIDFANSPFFVNARLSAWQTNGNPRRAGVSSFGIGGTNAHLVLEEPPPIEESGASRPWQLLVLSAKTSSALEAATTNLAAFLTQYPDGNLADVAYTLQVGRRAFPHRRMVVCPDLVAAVSALETRDPQRVLSAVHTAGARPVAFLFPGQGAQYVNMALSLYSSEPVFRAHVDRCAALLTPHLGCDLREVLYPGEERAEEAQQQLDQTWLTQPALFVIEYALARLWMAWGVQPDALVGHSIGEYVAACLSGVFCLEDALALVSVRGRLMQELPQGAMLAVSLSDEDVLPLLGQHLSLAAVNGPALCVVSGREDAVAELEHQLTQNSVACRLLHTSHAFHSEMMEPILETFTEQVKNVKLSPPQIPYLSNLTGTWVTAVEATDPNYWARHVRHTVRFAANVAELLKEPDRIFLEVGPGRTLSTFARQAVKSEQHIVLSSLRHPQDRDSDIVRLLNTAGQLWLAGLALDWSSVSSHEKRHRLPLPTYPFERERYWIDPQALPSAPHPRTQPDIADWFSSPSWKRSVMSAPQSNGRSVSSCWLVFLDACDLGDQLVQRLEHEGQHVIMVRSGDVFTKLNEQHYTLNPRHLDDYESLLAELHTLDRYPKTIVHLWSVSPNGSPASAVDWAETAQDFGFYSLLFLTQALGKYTVPDSVHIDVVSNNMHEVSGEETVCPAKATVLGPCKVIPQEYPNITCRSIDIVLPQPGTRQEAGLLDQLITELAINPPDSCVVAYRGKHRWIQTFEPIRLESPVEGNTRLREEGVYLITGGLGGIGLVLAEYLAQTVQAKLVLVGRSAFPPRNEWEQWLTTHDAQDKVSHKIQKVQALEALGAQVLVVSAEVSKQEQMQAVIKQATERFGAIHGVIHAAGVAGGGIMALKTTMLAASVLAPKLSGTLVLETLFTDRPLDFLVLCSSRIAIRGGRGQVDYCAANAFLDAFAHYRTSQSGSFTVSINWPTWQEVGMAVETMSALPSELKKQRQEDLKQGLLPKEGIEAFCRIMNQTQPQVMVSPRSAWEETDEAFSTSLAALEQTPRSIPIYARPELSSTYVPPGNEIERTVADIWQELLGLERVGIHDNFFDLGGHSLLAIQVLSRVRDTFEVGLTVRTFFECPTVAGLAEFLVQQQMGQVEEAELARLLAEVEELSLDETRAQLRDP